MISVFISYSHQDEDLRNELEKHLSALQREGVIDIWHDRRISPGEEIDREINTQLESADIILLLVSSDFIHSDYCYDIEMSRAMERHIAGSAKVIPVILRPCDWPRTPFGMLNATPTDGKPVTEHTSLDQGFLDVARAVRMAANELKATALQKSTPNTISNSPSTQLNDRSSNLRIKKEFTDRERHKFQDESFEYMAQYFASSLQELQSRNPEVETNFKRIDANHFEAVAYVNGKEQSRCGIWFGNSASLMDGLLFSYDGIGSDNSYNESMSVGDNSYTQYLKPMGMAHFGQNMDDELTREGAAEYYWGMFIEQLR